MRKWSQALIPLFSAWEDAAIWQAIQAKRAGSGAPAALDLKLPEWLAFSQPDASKENDDFKLRQIAAPKGFESFFEDTILVERIREVRALMGFTRIESNADFADATQIEQIRMTRIKRDSPTWLPASDLIDDAFNRNLELGFYWRTMR